MLYFWEEWKLARQAERKYKEIFKYHQEMDRQMWFRTAQGVEYKVNDEFIGVKMTREDAIKKVEKVCGSPLGKGNIVEALEALELIKFEEVDSRHSSEKGKYIFFPNSDKHKDNVSVLQVDAVSTMEKYGFEVKKLKTKYDCRELTFTSCKPLVYQAKAQLESLGYKVVEIENAK